MDSMAPKQLGRSSKELLAATGVARGLAKHATSGDPGKVRQTAKANTSASDIEMGELATVALQNAWLADVEREMVLLSADGADGVLELIGRHAVVHGLPGFRYYPPHPGSQIGQRPTALGLERGEIARDGCCSCRNEAEPASAAQRTRHRAAGRP